MEKYHVYSKDKVLDLVESNEEVGLTNNEASKRLKKYGYNELPKKKKDSVLKIFFSGLLDPIVMILVVTIIFSVIIGETVDAIVIGFIIFVDLLVGTIQEVSAEKSADALANLIKNGFTGCCMAFTANILQAVLPFPRNIPMHDWWIGLVSEKIGNVLFLNKPLVYYRRHGNNASNTAEKSKFSLIQKIEFRMNLFRGLLNIKKM